MEDAFFHYDFGYPHRHTRKGKKKKKRSVRYGFYIYTPYIRTPYIVKRPNHTHTYYYGCDYYNPDGSCRHPHRHW